MIINRELIKVQPYRISLPLSLALGTGILLTVLLLASGCSNTTDEQVPENTPTPRSTVGHSSPSAEGELVLTVSPEASDS